MVGWRKEVEDEVTRFERRRSTGQGATASIISRQKPPLGRQYQLRAWPFRQGKSSLVLALTWKGTGLRGSCDPRGQEQGSSRSQTQRGSRDLEDTTTT